MINRVERLRRREQRHERVLARLRCAERDAWASLARAGPVGVGQAGVGEPAARPPTEPLAGPNGAAGSASEGGRAAEPVVAEGSFPVVVRLMGRGRCWSAMC